MSVERRHFHAFVVIAAERNIGRAAQRLYISQPALSRQMQQLEREVGAPLLVRTTRGVELTETGEQLLEKSRDLLEAFDAALAVGRREEPRGPLALGLPLAGGRDLWFGLARAYAERYPRVEVEVRQAMTEHLQRQIHAGELDGAIGLAATRRAGLDYTEVHEQPLAVWVHETHELARA